MSFRDNPPIVLLLASLMLASCSLGACGLAWPAKLSDQEFWRIVEQFSEPGGEFRASNAIQTDNLISNETAFEPALALLQQINRPGAYVGVGPEQNFTYIAALKPTTAFIVDIRRGNMLLHLLYKALVEMSADRAEFLSRLFARVPSVRPRRNAAPPALFDAFRTVPHSQSLADETLRAVFDRLEHAHRFRLTAGDRRGIASMYEAFGRDGPDIRWDSSGDPWIPTYAEVMSQTDRHGNSHSYLASEQTFRTLKAYQMSNRIVPLVGDFAGDRTIRAIGMYLQEHDDAVAVFYASNVESYLRGDAPRKFAANVAGLPITPRSALIRALFKVAAFSKDRPQYQSSIVLLSIADFVRRSGQRALVRPVL